MKTLSPVKNIPKSNTFYLDLLGPLRTTKNQSGFTLINLLITLSISSLLISSGIPAITQTYYQQRANISYNELFTLIQFTRIQAVNYHSQAILCPTLDNINCINDWNQQLMIFIDKNNDEIKNKDEELLRVRTRLNTGEKIRWNASGSKRYLRFKSDGSTGNQNGRLSYCLTKAKTLYAKQIIMYRSGRARRGSLAQAIEKCSTLSTLN